jgi:hypothetical protein
MPRSRCQAPQLIGRKIFQHLFVKLLNLLLRGGQLALAEERQLGATPVGRNRFFQSELAGFHASDQLVELFERLFESQIFA